MWQKAKNWLEWALVAGLVVYVVWARGPWSSAPLIKEGEPAPDFSVRDLKGREWTLASFAGRPAVLVFFATWCGACREELPMVSRIAAERPDAGLIVVSEEAPDSVAAYLARAGLSLRAAGGASAMFRDFGIRVLPSAVLLDEQGIVQYAGAGTWAVTKALRGLAGPPP